MSQHTENPKGEDVAPLMWAFGGGKGGVGKSLVCASVAVELAQRHLRVVAVDVDFGAANLHTLLGLLHPPRGLAEFLSDPDVTLEEVCVETQVPGLRLLSGAATFLGTAHPDPAHRRRFISQLQTLDADVILIDLGAGAHYTTLDFFTIAGHRLIVSSPEPTSIQNTYGFLKAAAFRRLELALSEEPGFDALFARAVKPRGDDRLESIGQFMEAIAETNPRLAAQVREEIDDMRPLLVINQAGLEDEKRVYGALAVVCHRYLSFKPEHAGTLPDDPSVRVAVRRMRPVLIDAPDSAFGRCIGQLVERVLSQRANPGLKLVLEASERAARGTQLEEMNQRVSTAKASPSDTPSEESLAAPKSQGTSNRPAGSLADVLARVGPESRHEEGEGQPAPAQVEDSERAAHDDPEIQASVNVASESDLHGEGPAAAAETLIAPPFNESPAVDDEFDRFSPDISEGLIASHHQGSALRTEQFTETGDIHPDSLGGVLDDAVLGDLSEDLSMGESGLSQDSDALDSETSPDGDREVSELEETAAAHVEVERDSVTDDGARADARSLREETVSPAHDGLEGAPTGDTDVSADALSAERLSDEAVLDEAFGEPTDDAPADEATVDAPADEATDDAPADEATVDAPADEATDDEPFDEPTDDVSADEPTADLPPDESASDDIASGVVDDDPKLQATVASVSPEDIIETSDAVIQGGVEVGDQAAAASQEATTSSVEGGRQSRPAEAGDSIALDTSEQGVDDIAGVVTGDDNGDPLEAVRAESEETATHGNKIDESSADEQLVHDSTSTTVEPLEGVQNGDTGDDDAALTAADTSESGHGLTSSPAIDGSQAPTDAQPGTGERDGDGQLDGVGEEDVDEEGIATDAGVGDADDGIQADGLNGGAPKPDADVSETERAGQESQGLGEATPANEEMNPAAALTEAAPDMDPPRGDMGTESETSASDPDISERVPPSERPESNMVDDSAPSDDDSQGIAAAPSHELDTDLGKRALESNEVDVPTDPDATRADGPMSPDVVETERSGDEGAAADLVELDATRTQGSSAATASLGDEQTPAIADELSGDTDDVSEDTHEHPDLTALPEAQIEEPADGADPAQDESHASPVGETPEADPTSEISLSDLDLDLLAEDAEALGSDDSVNDAALENASEVTPEINDGPDHTQVVSADNRDGERVDDDDDGPPATSQSDHQNDASDVDELNPDASAPDNEEEGDGEFALFGGFGDEAGGFDDEFDDDSEDGFGDELDEALDGSFDEESIDAPSQKVGGLSPGASSALIGSDGHNAPISTVGDPDAAMLSENDGGVFGSLSGSLAEHTLVGVGAGVFGDDVLSLHADDDDDDEVQVLIPDDTLTGGDAAELDADFFNAEPIGEARTSDPPVPIPDAVIEDPADEETWFEDPSVEPVRIDASALERVGDGGVFSVLDLEPMLPGPDLDAELAELDAELAELDLELVGQENDDSQPVSRRHRSAYGTGRRSDRRSFLPAATGVQRPSLRDVTGLSDSMVQAMAETIGESLSEEPAAPLAQETFESDAWDADPWAQIDVAQTPAGQLSVQTKLEAPLELDVADLIIEPDSPKSDNRMPDPLGHPVISLNEEVTTPNGEVHLFTEDRAPERACVRHIVRRPGGGTMVHETDYKDLLGPDQRAVDPSLVPSRVEALHQDVRRTLELHGVDGLAWKMTGRGDS